MSNIKNMTNNQPINSNSSETGFKKKKNNLVNPNLSSTQTEAIVTGLSENAFECIIKNIKAENFPLVSDESSDTDNSTEIDETSANGETLNKHENNKNMSNKVDLNVFESNLQMQKNTNLLDTGPTENISGTSSLSTLQVLKSLKTSHHTKFTHKCNECCEWCKKSFAIFDNPNHIGRIRNIEKQNEFLKIEPTLNINSCLCDRCFKYLERVNKFNETEKRKGLSNSNDITKIDEILVDESSIQNNKKKHKKRNRSRKRIGKADICSVHRCSRYSIHQISIEECAQIKQIFSTFYSSRIIFIESKKKTKKPNCSLFVCDLHLSMLNVITTCNICGNKLDGSVNPEDWKMYKKWNLILKRNGIPLKLQPGMFVCITCRCCISEDSFSINDLGIFQRTVLKRIDVCTQLFGPPQNNISKTYQVSDIGTPHSIFPIVVANMPKSDNLTKIKFADPLITSTYYFTPDNSEHHRKHKGKKKSNFSNPEIKSNEYTKLSDSLIKDELTGEENLEYDDYMEENNFETSMTENSVNISSNLYHNPRRYRILKMMGLLKKEVDIKSEYIPVLLENNEEQLPINLKETHNNLNDLSFESNQNAVAACMDVEKDLLPSHVISLLDGDENNLPTKEETIQYNSNEIEIKVEIDDQNEPMIPGIHSNQNSDQNSDVMNRVPINHNVPVITNVFSLQSLCNGEDVESNDNMSLSVTKRGTVEDLETYKNMPVISSVFSQADKIVLPVIATNEHPQQSKNRVNNFETYKNSAVITGGVYSDQSVCRVDDVDSDENTNVRSDQNLCMVEDVENIPVSTISVYSDVSTCGVEDVESGKEMPVNTGIDSDQIVYIVNPVNSKNSDPNNISVEPLITTKSGEIRKKLRSVICQRISKVRVQKRNLDKPQDNQLNTKKPRLYNKATKFNDTLSNESDNKTNSSYNNNFVADNSVELCTNEDFCNSDSVEDLSTTDEEISCMKDKSIDQLNADKLAIQMNSNLDPNCAGPIRFHRTLQKVHNFCAFNEVGTPDHISIKSNILDTNSVPVCEIMSHKDILSDKSTQDESTHKYELFPQPYKLTDDELIRFQHLEHPEEIDDLDDDKYYNLHFQLDKSNRQIYGHLLNNFKDESLLFSYLMENERMLYNRELVVSKTANKVTIDYLNKHLASLSRIYGDPEQNKADVSYLLDAPAFVRHFSKRKTSEMINKDRPLSTSTPIAVSTPVDHVYHAKNKPSTSSTYTKSKTTTSQIFNVVPATGNVAISPNFQSSSVLRPKSYIPQTAIRSSFQLPTAVRTNGMFLQTNKSNCPLRPRSFTYNVRN